MNSITGPNQKFLTYLKKTMQFFGDSWDVVREVGRRVKVALTIVKRWLDYHESNLNKIRIN